MKELVFGLVAAAVVGGGVYFGTASGGYEMSAKDARTKLLKADYRVENGPFNADTSEIAVSNPSENTVQWTATENGNLGKTCKAVITPLAENEIEVTASCSSIRYSQSGQGAFFAEVAQAAITEFVD